MASIYCINCGRIFDVLERACPRCGRCPACGTRVSANNALGCSCGHPNDECKLAFLADRLDPSKPSNEGELRSARRSQENQEVMVRAWGLRYFAVSLGVILPLSLAIGNGLGAGLGLPMKPSGWFDWRAALIGISFHFLQFVFLTNLLRKGYFPWMLRPSEQECRTPGGQTVGPTE